MIFLELVNNRRSIRSYSDKEVPREKIEACLEAARLSPSACNAQPWSFIVVDDKQLKDELACNAFSGIYAMNAFAARAPVLIAVITEKSKLSAQFGGLIRQTEYSRIDIGIACEHLILQAVEEGLGTCWIGWFNEAHVKKTLRIPNHKKIDVMLCLGYPDYKALEEQQRKSLDEIRSYNREKNT
ncbi:MAG: nitroreductase family protein [bacterium]